MSYEFKNLNKTWQVSEFSSSSSLINKENDEHIASKLILIPKRKYSRLFSLKFHYQYFVCSSEVTKLAIPGLGFLRNIEEMQCGISLG